MDTMLGNFDSIQHLSSIDVCLNHDNLSLNSPQDRRAPIEINDKVKQFSNNGNLFFFFFETVGDVDMEIISGDLVEVSSPTKPSFRTWKRMLCKSTNPSPNTNSCHNITHLSNRQPLKLLKLFLHLLETLITRDKQLR